MIELSPEQRQAMAQGQPVRIIDPLTHDAFILVRAEDYERLAELSQRPLDRPNPGIRPMVLRSMQAFWPTSRAARSPRNRARPAFSHPRGNSPHNRI